MAQKSPDKKISRIGSPILRSASLPWDRVVLSVVIPVYNEIATVEKLLRQVREVPLDLDVIVVDDGSTDGTRDLLVNLADELIDQLCMHEKNMGKGAALRTGFERVKGHVVVIQDADLEYDPLELPVLLEPILSGKADAVYGSRFLGGPHRVLLFWHSVGNRLLTLLSNILTDVNLTDMETCYKMIRADLLQSLPLSTKRFGIEPELTARLAQQVRASTSYRSVITDVLTPKERKSVGEMAFPLWDGSSRVIVGLPVHLGGRHRSKILGILIFLLIEL
jgi:hypothetical protein